MSKPCRRPTRAALKKLRSTKKQQEKALNAKLSATGALPSAGVSLPNRCSTFATVAEEQAAREEAVSRQMRLLRKELPAMLEQLATIPDPRDPKKCRHKLTVLLRYGASCKTRSAKPIFRGWRQERGTRAATSGMMWLSRPRS